MDNKNSPNTILLAVIEAYRAYIEQRYQYDYLNENFSIPDSFDSKRIERFRQYFLEYVYPPPSKREELNEAFDSLDSYIKQPQKLLRILLDSGSLLFKYGRHLPKILRAGLQALQSFRTGSTFERKLVQQARKLELSPPFGKAEIELLIQQLPYSDIEQFIVNSQSLFETLYDRALIKKIIEIVEHLIVKMKQRPKLFTVQEIKGLEIGRDIIKEGNALFDELTQQEQKLIFNMIIEIERTTLEQLFKTS